MAKTTPSQTPNSFQLTADDVQANSHQHRRQAALHVQEGTEDARLRGKPNLVVNREHGTLMSVVIAAVPDKSTTTSRSCCPPSGSRNPEAGVPNFGITTVTKTTIVGPPVGAQQPTRALRCGVRHDSSPSKRTRHGQGRHRAGRAMRRPHWRGGVSPSSGSDVSATACSTRCWLWVLRCSPVAFSTIKLDRGTHADRADDRAPACVLPRRSRCRSNVLGVHSAHSGHCVRKDRIAVVGEIPRRLVIGKGVAKLLRRPGCCRMLGDRDVHDPLPVVREDHEHEE